LREWRAGGEEYGGGWWRWRRRRDFAQPPDEARARIALRAIRQIDLVVDPPWRIVHSEHGVARCMRVQEAQEQLGIVLAPLTALRRPVLPFPPEAWEDAMLLMRAAGAPHHVRVEQRAITLRPKVPLVPCECRADPFGAGGEPHRPLLGGAGIRLTDG